MTATETDAAMPGGIPSPTLRVIGAGFGRTGTLSLREALVRLGYGPCDHMLENFARPERFALWLDAFQRKQRGAPIDWRPLLGGYRAVVDWPGAYFWRELTAAHPAAKVILTVRDPHRWYESAEATIYAMRARQDSSPWTRVLIRGLGLLVPSMAAGARVGNDVIWDGTFGGRFPDHAHALAVFEEHNRAVQEAIPPERLLVFDVKEGWGPLCAFLGVPVPEGEPFPHVNDAQSFQRMIQERFAGMAVRAAGMLLVAVGIIAALVWLAWRGRGREDR